MQAPLSGKPVQQGDGVTAHAAGFRPGARLSPVAPGETPRKEGKKEEVNAMAGVAECASTAANAVSRCATTRGRVR